MSVRVFFEAMTQIGVVISIILLVVHSRRYDKSKLVFVGPMIALTHQFVFYAVVLLSIPAFTPDFMSTGLTNWSSIVTVHEIWTLVATLAMLLLDSRTDNATTNRC